MVTFGEPEPEGLTSAGRKKSGWHKKSAATWRAKQRSKNSRPREIKPRIRTAAKRFAPVEHPCPLCFAPVRDGVCTGAFSMANGGLHDER